MHQNSVDASSDAANNVASDSDNTVCPACDGRNDRSRRFCNECGEALTLNCPQCSTERHCDERHCGQCGFGLAKFISDSQSECHNALQNAQRPDAPVTEAIQMARSVIQSEAPFVSAFRAKAADLIQKLNEDQKAESSKISSYCGEIERLTNDRDIPAAFKFIQSLGAVAEDESLKPLVESVTASHSEVLELRKQIQTRIKSKELAGLLQPVLDLCRISANEKGAKDLIKKLILFELKQAKAFSTVQKYADGCQSLEQIPDSLKDDRITAFQATLKELSIYQSYLQQSPIADLQLLKIGQRLAEAEKGNERTTKLVATLKARLVAARKDSASNVTAWVTPKINGDEPPVKITHVACIDIPNWQIKLDASSRKKWQQHTADWQAAAGVALQVVERSRISTNLLPTKKSLGLFRRKAATATGGWGLSCDDGAVHLAKVVVAENGQLRLAHYDRESLKSSSRGEAIVNLLERNEFGTSPVGTTLPASQCISRHTNIPRLDSEKKLNAAIEFEAKHQIPFPLEGLHWDKFICGKDGNTVPVMLLAARREHVERASEPLPEKAAASLVQCDALATYNWAIAGWEEHETNRRVFLNIGEQSSYLVACGQSVPLFASLNWGVNSVRMSIEERLSISAEKLDAVINSPASVKRLTPIAEALDKSYEEFQVQIRRSLNGFDKSIADFATPNTIVLMGTGSSLFGLARFLQMNWPID